MRKRIGIAWMIALLLQSLNGSAFAGPYKAFVDDQTRTIRQGQSVTLTANAPANQPAPSAYQWVKDGQRITGAIHKDLIVTTAGRYQVILMNSDGCESIQSDGVNIQVDQPNIYADMAIDVKAVRSSDNLDDPFKYVISIKNNGVNDATSVKIQDQLPNEVQLQQLIKPLKGVAEMSNNTLIWNIGKVSVGETADLSMIVKALKAGTITNAANVSATEPDPVMANNVDDVTTIVTQLIIPNVFTPNGDNVNDTFVIPGLDSYSGNELTIVNRWDATVYHKINYKNDWTGDGLNEGTYFYILKVKQPTGDWSIYKGYVTLLRSRQ